MRTWRCIFGVAAVMAGSAMLIAAGEAAGGDPGATTTPAMGGATAATMPEATPAKALTAAQRTALTKEARAVIEANLKACQDEDLDACAKTIDPKSPMYAGTLATMRNIFQAYNLHYKVMSFEWVGATGEYVVVRVCQRTTRVAGPEFRDNDVDALHVLRRRDGKLRIWTSCPLEVKFLADEKTPPATETQPAAEDK